MGGSAGLAIFPDGLACGLKQYGRPGFAHSKVDRAEHGAVHSAERLEMGSGVQDRDIDRHADFFSPRLACGDDLARFVNGNHLPASFFVRG